MEHETEISERREPADLNPKWIYGVGLGTAAFLAASLGGLWLYYDMSGARTGFRLPEHFPPPRLQSDPAGDLRDFRAAQRAELQTSAPRAADRGVVAARIPIEQAMETIAARGPAAYDPLDPPAAPTGPAAGPEARR